MLFLERATQYAEARGDSDRFLEIYREWRYNHGVRDSVRYALTVLYSCYSADLLEYQ